MKLIIAGATGFVATEVIRQSLRISTISSVIALARRPVSVPDNLEAGADATKFKSVVLQDFGTYSDEDKKHLAGADACIWTLAITPTKSKSMEWEEVRKVNHDYTLTGLKAIFEVRNQNNEDRVFRFCYMSGIAAERDQTKTPFFMPQYCLMRGEVENQVLAFAAEHKGNIEACVVKPGAIKQPGLNFRSVLATVVSPVVPSVQVTEVSAAMLDQVINGFEKEPLMNDDLVRLGQKALKSLSST